MGFRRLALCTLRKLSAVAVPHLAHAALAESRCEASAGHSAIGTLSVYALLIVLLAQVIAGMFTNDGTFTEGPWVKFVSEARSAIALSTFHYYNGWLIVALDAAARRCDCVLPYWLRRNDLITPMLTGDKLGLNAIPAEDGAAIRVRAAVLAAIAGAVVYYVVT